MEVKCLNSSSKDEIIRELNNSGVLVVKNFLKPKELINIKEEYYTLLNNSTKYNWVEKRDYSNGEAVLIETLKMEDDFFIKSFLLNPFFEKIVYQYFKQRVVTNHSFFCVKDVIGTKHIAQDFHFDVQRTLKFFFYLNDVNENNGAFRCIPGSHKHVGKIRKKYKNEISYKNRDLTRVNDFQNERTHVCGNAGDLIIFDTDTLHATGHVSEGERLVLRAQSSPYFFNYDISLSSKIKNKIKSIFSK